MLRALAIFALAYALLSGLLLLPTPLALHAPWCYPPFAFAAAANNYFYMPALGYYDFGQLSNIGIYGYYWSSSANPRYSGHAYALNFLGGGVSVDYYDRFRGYRVGGFE